MFRIGKMGIFGGLKEFFIVRKDQRDTAVSANGLYRLNSKYLPSPSVLCIAISVKSRGTRATKYIYVKQLC